MSTDARRHDAEQDVLLPSDKHGLESVAPQGLELESADAELEDMAAAPKLNAPDFGPYPFGYPMHGQSPSVAGLPRPAFDEPQDMAQPPSVRNGQSCKSTAGYRAADSDDDDTANMAGSFDDLDEFGLGGDGPATNSTKTAKSADKADVSPAWSELKTKAGKERKRLPLACTACRRKKIRCSGEKPACKHCLRSHSPCVYKVTARKAAPRTDYMAMLDKRLKRMEERIIQVAPKAEQDRLVSCVTRAVVKPAMPGSSKSAATKRAADEAFGADIDGWARAPVKARIADSASAHEADESKLLVDGKDALPSKELQAHLAEVFFENIYGQAYHLLHKPSYMRDLRAETLPPVLILSVCAVAARFSTHPNLKTGPTYLRGEAWAAPARDMVVQRYEWPNMTILTCLLLLGLHEFGTCHGGRSWAFAGAAIRMAFALQLHRDVASDLSGKMSFVDGETRRRTMWACFLMDRLSSSGTDRPTFVREESLRIPLPIKERNYQLAMPGIAEALDGGLLGPEPDAPLSKSRLTEARANLGVAAWICRAMALWGRILSYLNQGGRDLDAHPIDSPASAYMALLEQTDNFANSLPASLTWTSDNIRLHKTENLANQLLLLHICIQQNVLFLNRFAASSPSRPHQRIVPKDFVTRAAAKALAAAAQVSAILREGDENGQFITAPFAGYCAFLSSTVHIVGLFSGITALEATSKANLNTNLRFLARMMRQWGMFRLIMEQLKQLYRTWADGARPGLEPAQADASMTPESPASSPIFQYADWFDRYPSGVSPTDFLDPALCKHKGKDKVALGETKPDVPAHDFLASLSPQSSESTGPPHGPMVPQAQQPRRSSCVGNQSVPCARSDASLESLQADLMAAQVAQAQARAQQVRQQQQQCRHFSPASGSGGLGSHSPTAFDPLITTTAYHGLSPVSPAALPSQFDVAHGHPGHVPQLHPTSAAALFQPDPSFCIASPGGPSCEQGQAALGPSPLDRHLLFGYGGADPSLALAAWAAAEQAHDGGGGENVLCAAMPGAGLSSAWFLPFKMDTPVAPESAAEAPGHTDGGGAHVGFDGFAPMFAMAENSLYGPPRT